MENWITNFIEQFGYLSVLLLIMLENVFPPIPSEIILAFGGFATTYTELSVPGVIAFATTGSVFGAFILYGVGRLLDVRRLERIISRYGKILGLKVQDVYKAESWFNRYGYWTVFFCRMIPIIRSLISIPAGMAKMKFSLFIVFTIAGTLIWNTLLVSAGAFLGESWEIIVDYMDVYSDIVYIVVAVVGVVILGIWFYQRIWKKRR